MATLALAAVGSAVGSTLLPAGIGFLGTTLTGAAIGAQVGAFAGSYVDHALFGSSGRARPVEGPRLSEFHITGSTEGEAIPRVYGRARLGGQVIWADAIEERVSKHKSGEASAKGAAASGESASTTVEYTYYASFAVAIAEGEISGLGRVWADGERMNLSRVHYRVHKGCEDQLPDSFIETRLGAGAAPAFRGTAYIVFQRLPLAPYGNRLPQLTFEVHRAVEPFNKAIQGVVIIPGSGEFVYATEAVSNDLGLGRSESVNDHTLQGATDWQASIDQLEETLPNAKSASLVVSWFGTDLRAGSCEVKPGVEIASKATEPLTWRVAGLDRSAAHVVSQREGRPAYGGTPSDETVIQAIQDLRARGFSVTLNPFVLMDVPEGNALPNPYDGSGSQPAYPWRGRITISPAPGQAGSPDKSPAAAAQVNAFVGTADVADFSISGSAVHYAGPAEWTYRRMVLHMAHLAKAAGGVDAFLLGSELRGLTWVRDGASSYPFVASLLGLAADVKAVLGAGTKVTYAADWSEYFGHQPQDGSGDVYFHLDPLWASNDIDAIGLDLYWPLSDWRDGTAHSDYAAGHRSIYDLSYLRRNVAGGEGYDWYYASEADRAAQVRSPITDGAGKPWVFRYKDLLSWWSSTHVDRPGGIESGSPTPWVPQSKPFWIMETGCPAADKGANQPNVFVDPKSSETALPYFSNGRRDDLMQRRYLKALIDAFDPASEGYVSGLNPVSTVYGDRMVDLSRIHVYAWDARPFPEFPNNIDVWGDADNWRLGHWLNGRFASGSLSETLERVFADYGFSDYAMDNLDGIVTGYVIDRVMSAREAIEPLELAYFFDTLESEGRIILRPRGAQPLAWVYDQASLVEERPGEALLTLTRAQETELPASAKISYIAVEGAYRQAVAEARRLAGASGRISQAGLPIVLEPEMALEIAETWLFESWASRERASFTLPPSSLALEVGDTVVLDTGNGQRSVRITEVGEHGGRAIEARSIDPEVYGRRPTASRRRVASAGPLTGRPLVEFLDLPLLRGDEPPAAGYVAALQTPWPGGVAIYASPETTGYGLRALAAAPAVMGVTLNALCPGPIGVLDLGTRLQVQVDGGELASVSRLQLLAGQNLAAVRNADGQWEILQFETAELTGTQIYQLSGLIRGQAGSELAMRDALAAGARFVLLTPELERIDLTLDEVRLPLNWRYGPVSSDIGAPSYAGRVHAFQGEGLKPLAPVHVRGRRSGGDLVLSWIRRTRSGGDSWDSVEVPLAEDSEHYEIDILDGETVKRTISSLTTSAIYTVAEQAADFGAPQAACALRINQMSAVYGRGSARSAVV